MKIHGLVFGSSSRRKFPIFRKLQIWLRLAYYEGVNTEEVALVVQLNSVQELYMGTEGKRASRTESLT
jgi:hypothetical protein